MVGYFIRKELKMKLRIAGKITEKDYLNGIMKFVPDAEFVSSWRKDDKTIVKYAVFQPIDLPFDVGVVVKFEGKLHFTCGGTRLQDVFVLGGHIELELMEEPDTTKTNIKIEELQNSGSNGGYRVTKAVAK